MNLREYHRDSKRLLVSFLIIAPLLLIYELGILLANPAFRNGADAVLRRAFALLGPKGEWIWLGCLLTAILICAFFAFRDKLPAHSLFFPVFLEGFTYALLFGPIVLLLRSYWGSSALEFREFFPVAHPSEISPALNLLLAVGAGVYEEIFFRLILLSLLYYLCKKFCHFLALPDWVGAVSAIVISSLSFSAFHHIGEYAAPFSWEAFAFRSIAGSVLGAIFILRGLGVAVYTHAFYDILYLFLPLFK